MINSDDDILATDKYIIHLSTTTDIILAHTQIFCHETDIDTSHRAPG